MPENFEEKRKEPRKERDLKVDIVFFHLDEEIKYDFSSSTASLDVSFNGIRLIEKPDADISMDKPVEMKINFPGTDNTFEAIGQVKWKKNVDGILHFGVEIITMAEWEKFKALL